MIDRATAKNLARRAIVLWLVLRVGLGIVIAILSLLGLASGSGSFDFYAGAIRDAAASPSILPFLVFAFLVTTLLVLDLRATGEETLLANLGVGRRHVIAIAVACSLVLEGGVVALALALSA